ncbi:unnamed protein product [Cuscuta campestris]|uniref:Uncharacterized protein n=1 Tax=Cuscuta campestris TaxID=132261 RepID=A0A484NKE0_9ASTE|nr:unnamed protein product [Cuscuta campestris]
MDVDDDEEQWEKFRKWAAACVVAYATYAIFLISLIRGPNHKNDESIIERDYERQSLIRRLTNMNDEDCREQLRMRKGAFANLVNILRG